MISERTYKVVTLNEVTQITPSECVVWAIEMMELGNETPSLLMLAATSLSSSYFEVKPYLESSILELGLKLKYGEQAIISYAYYFIKQISEGRDIKSNLTKLHNFCIQRDYEAKVYDFFLLQWAWDQIAYDDSNSNHYWTGANANNIEQTVIEVSTKWINENFKHYVQLVTMTT